MHGHAPAQLLPRSATLRPQGQRLKLERVVLGGLGPAPPAARPPLPPLRNLVSCVWAFSFPRRQVALHLRNVTLYTSEDEVRGCVVDGAGRGWVFGREGGACEAAGHAGAGPCGLHLPPCSPC